MQILGCKKIRPTGRNLARALSARYIENNIDHSDMTIRYGNSYVEDPTNGTIINKKESVQLSSNKPRCKQTLMEAGIPTPRKYSFQEVFDGRATFPVIVRRNGHFQGRYFYMVNNVRELSRYDPSTHYIQEVVNKINEYRLFVMKDRIIEADLKETPPGHNSMVRNHETGCFFRWVRVASLPTELKRAARDAIQTCGLDFGAIDCATIQTPNGVKPTIFEVNSAPGLIPRKVDLFVAKLHELYLD